MVQRAMRTVSSLLKKRYWRCWYSLLWILMYVDVMPGGRAPIGSPAPGWGQHTAGGLGLQPQMSPLSCQQLQDLSSWESRSQWPISVPIFPHSFAQPNSFCSCKSSSPLDLDFLITLLLVSQTLLALMTLTVLSGTGWVFCRMFPFRNLFDVILTVRVWW